MITTIALLSTASLLLADPYLEVEYYGARFGTDSLGNVDEDAFGGDLVISGPDVLSQPFLAGGDTRTGSMFSAVGDIQAQGVVGLGYLRAVATVGAVQTAAAGVLTHPYFGAMDAIVYARFQDDTVVIDAPGMTGQSGTLAASFTVDMDMLVEGFVIPESSSGAQNATLFASADFRLDIGNETFSYSALHSLDNSGGSSAASDFPEPGDVQHVSVPFVYGTPFRIRGRASVSALVDASEQGFAQGRAIAQFPGSFRWLGMDMFALAPGATVQGMIDWTQPAALPPDAAAPDAAAPAAGGGGGAMGVLALLVLLLGGAGLRRRYLGH